MLRRSSKLCSLLRNSVFISPVYSASNVALCKYVGTRIVNERKLITKNKAIELGRSRPERGVDNVQDIDPADTFGGLSDEITDYDDLPDDPEDEAELKRMRQAEIRTYKSYADEIKQHLNNHDYDSAVAVLEEKMLKIDKKRPHIYFYRLLCDYNAKTRNLKEAFRLFKGCRERGMFITPQLYTIMFNACALSRKREYALKCAEQIRKRMSNKEEELLKVNVKVYNAMVKAYAMQGDLVTAFHIFDEVLKKRGRLQGESFNFLLWACISDKNAGFRHALLVWHKMLVHKALPDIYTFNLLLSCANRCSVGPIEIFEEAIQNIMEESEKRHKRKLLGVRVVSRKLKFKIKEPTKENTDSEENKETENVTTDNSVVLKDSTPELPNMLDHKPSTGSVVKVSSMNMPSDRLALLGGVEGFINTMISFNVKPNHKTLTGLLQNLKWASREEEEDIIAYAKRAKIDLDVRFANVLLLRRALHADKEWVQRALALMQDYALSPDIVTIGTLAHDCDTLEECLRLFADAKNLGLRLNSQTLQILSEKALASRDPKYMLAILKAARDDEVELSPRFVATLNTFRKGQKREEQQKASLNDIQNN